VTPDTRQYILNHYEPTESGAAGRRIFSKKVSGSEVVELGLEEFARHLGASPHEIERLLCDRGFRIDSNSKSPPREGDGTPAPRPIGWNVSKSIRNLVAHVRDCLAAVPVEPPRPPMPVEPPPPPQRPRVEPPPVAKAAPIAPETEPEPTPRPVVVKKALTAPPPPALLHCSACGRLMSDREWGVAGYFGGACEKCRGNEHEMVVLGMRDPGGPGRKC
jgi:hypothetical protein